MQLDALWRTTTFRLTVLYGLLFAAGTVALLGMVYLQSVVYLTHRVDGILQREADGFVQSPPPELRARIVEALALNGSTTNIFALFTAGGARIVGNLAAVPATLVADGAPIEIAPSLDFPVSARLIARRLASGELLVVGRDVEQLRTMRAIIGSALFWSGISILFVGIACGTALSLSPLRRLRTLQAAGARIAAGDLEQRMPVSGRRDELDMLATAVNAMMDQVERLMSEVKGATDVIAHDLLTPLTRARTRLSRILQTGSFEREELALVGDQIDEVMERFRAILRITELDTRARRAGFARVDLNDIGTAVADLYAPLAEAAAVKLVMRRGAATGVDADAKLLIEAVSNLVDNAIKFNRPGGSVRLAVGADAAEPAIVVEDDGPGIPVHERVAVLQRFRRAGRHSSVPGSGIGLAVVAAIVRLHEFQLRFEDASPGLRAIIDCRRTAPGS
jgi:signal transduction histidine kinase